MALEQEGFRWRNDNGSETTATWKDTQDTNINIALDTPVRLRLAIDVSTDPSGAAKYRLEYKKSTDSQWIGVPPQGTSGHAVTLALSSNITASGEATTAQLTAPSGKTTGDFVTGRMWDDENGVDEIPTIPITDYTEFEWCIQAISGVAVASDIYQFRATREVSPVTASAPVLDATSASGDGSGLTLSWTHTSTGTDRGVVVFVAEYVTNIAGTCTYDGVPMVHLLTINGGQATTVHMFALAGQSTTTNATIQFTTAQSQSADTLGGAAISFTNCHPSTYSMTGPVSSVTAADTAQSVTSDTDELVVSGVYQYNDADLTTNAAGMTEQVQTPGGNTEVVALATATGVSPTTSIDWAGAALGGSISVSLRPPAATLVTLDPSNKSSNVTLSNSNYTATIQDAVNGYQNSGIRATASISGKKFWRVILTDVTGTDVQAGVGIMAGTTYNNGTGFSTDYSAVVAGSGSGDLSEFLLNNSYTADGVITTAQGDFIDIAFDATAELIWFRRNNTGNWNNNASADPATGTGGYSVTASQTWYPYVAGYSGATGDEIAYTFIAADDGSGAAPSGFSWIES